MTIQITLRYTDILSQPQTWHHHRDGSTYITTVYPQLTPDQLLDVDRLHDPRIVESTLRPAEYTEARS